MPLPRCIQCGSPIIVYDKKHPHLWSDLYCEKCVNRTDYAKAVPRLRTIFQNPLFLGFVITIAVIIIAGLNM